MSKEEKKQIPIKPDTTGTPFMFEIQYCKCGKEQEKNRFKRCIKCKGLYE